MTFEFCWVLMYWCLNHAFLQLILFDLELIDISSRHSNSKCVHYSHTIDVTVLLIKAYHTIKPFWFINSINFKLQWRVTTTKSEKQFPLIPLPLDRKLLVTWFTNKWWLLNTTKPSLWVDPRLPEPFLQHVYRKGRKLAKFPIFRRKS